MHTCAVYSCDSNTHTKGVNFFRVPTNREEAQGWINFITETNSGVTPRIKSGRLYVCSKHFRRCCIYPCNPRRNRLIAGHFPSVVDGKVLLNAQSKCALISADENLNVYAPPTYRSTQEKQRAYLVQQLTSFNVRRKIVIGDRNRNTFLKRMNDCTLSSSEEAIMSSTPTVSPNQCSSSSQASDARNNQDSLQCSFMSCNETGDGMVSIRKNANVMKTPSQSTATTTAPIKVEQEVVMSTKYAKESTTKPKVTRPSVQTKLTLALRDNANLKKSVSLLEKKVKEMEEEMKRMKYSSANLEKHYKKLLKRFQRKLEQKEANQAAGNFSAGIVTKVSNCKCALIDYVDISED